MSDEFEKMPIDQEGFQVDSDLSTMLNRVKVPGGWLTHGYDGQAKATYVPDPAYWIAQFVEQTACKKCKGTGSDSYQNHLGSRTTTKCDACGGKGR